MRNKTMLVGVSVVIGLLLAAAGIVLAGSLNPGVGPTAAEMKTNAPKSAPRGDPQC